MFRESPHFVLTSICKKFSGSQQISGVSVACFREMIVKVLWGACIEVPGRISRESQKGIPK